jgi:hypothetical protein
LWPKISSGTETLASATDRKNGTSSETVHDIKVLGIIWLINPGTDYSIPIAILRRFGPKSLVLDVDYIITTIFARIPKI